MVPGRVVPGGAWTGAAGRVVAGGAGWCWTGAAGRVVAAAIGQ